MKFMLNEYQLKYVLHEAIEIAKAKEYVNIQRSPEVTKKINNIFDLLKQKYPTFRTSKRGDRLYVPFGSKLESEIKKVLDNNDYEIEDLEKGLVFNKRTNQKLKLGKALTRIGREDLLTNYNTDKSKGVSSNPSGYMVFSKHPYDIAGMTSGRDWTSCMDLYDGQNRRYVSCDITEGTFIVYLINTDDINIKNPKGRILIKPYINQQDTNDIIFFPEDKTYGSIPSEFQNEVENFFNVLNSRTKGILYKKNEKLYKDGNRHNFNNFKNIKTIKDVENLLSNATNTDKKEMALDNEMVLDYIMKSPKIHYVVKDDIIKNSLSFKNISKYVTVNFLLKHRLSSEILDLVDRFPEIKEIILNNPIPFFNRFLYVLIKFNPNLINSVSNRTIRNLRSEDFFNIIEENPNIFPRFFNKNKDIFLNSYNSYDFCNFISRNPQFLIKVYPVLKPILREKGGYYKDLFLRDTLREMPELFNFYLYNEKELLDHFFSEPTRSNEIIWKNNKLFYLVHRNYPSLIDELIEFELYPILNLNPSLLPFFVKFYKEKLLKINGNTFFYLMRYKKEIFEFIIKNIPEIIKLRPDNEIDSLKVKYPEYKDEIMKIKYEN